jgi:hypothetical protein
MSECLTLPTSVPENHVGNYVSNNEATSKNKPVVTDTNTVLIEMLRADPRRTFTISNGVQHTGSSRQNVKMAFSRLASPGSPAPVMRVARGIYRYDPAKENPGINELVRLGYWRVENIVLVTKGTHPPCELPLKDPVIISGAKTGNKQQPTPKTGYPLRLPTGQRVNWERYDNSTEMIRLSVNGAMPFSPDHILTLFYFLKKDGLDDNWDCVSLEINIDSRDLRYDSSISLQVLEGLVFKSYNHGPGMRVELADRRRCSLGEVMQLLTGLVSAVDARDALQQCGQIRNEMKEIAGTSRLALNISRKTREKVDEINKLTPKNPQKVPAPMFRTAAKLLKENSSTSDQNPPVKDHLRG